MPAKQFFAPALKAASAAVLLIAASGCSLLSKPQLAACQAEKQQLLARIKQDQDRLVASQARERMAVARLAESEKQVALLHDRQAGDAQLAARDDAPRSWAPDAGSDNDAAGNSAGAPSTDHQRTANRSDGWSPRAAAPPETPTAR